MSESKITLVKSALPPPETPVLAWVHGLDCPIVLEMLWETCNPMIESHFEDFLYWDNPHNDGQDYEDRVIAWMPLPELVTVIDKVKEND